MAQGISDVAAAVGEIGARWRVHRAERQERRHLDRADFDALREVGLLRLPVPADMGGHWEGSPASTRRMCEIYRRLASCDSSVALVSAMHPSVIRYWLANQDPEQPDWEDQRRAVFESALAGEQWGTITSEPGSGGDIRLTRAVATPSDAPPFLCGRSFTVTGDKHFGSGMGIVDRMVTSAIAHGEAEPMIFVLDVADRPWDASAGLELVAEWDGMGMIATQSHAMRLDHAPAVRLAWERDLDSLIAPAQPLHGALFTSVIVGVLDEAIVTARERLRPRAHELRAYEQVEWSRAERDHWVAVQVYDGLLRAIETGDVDAARYAVVRTKHAVAELAEDTLLRLSRVLGGGTYSRRSPFAAWFEDVRALGFLRPPWGLAADALLESSFPEPPVTDED